MAAVRFVQLLGLKMAPIRRFDLFAREPLLYGAPRLRRCARGLRVERLASRRRTRVTLRVLLVDPRDARAQFGELLLKNAHSPFLCQGITKRVSLSAGRKGRAEPLS